MAQPNSSSQIMASPSTPRRPRVLVIAGSDSSGGAGLEADQRVLTAHGCYSMTATTALTAQNTLGVEDIHVTPPAFVAKQINACLSDIDCDAVKIGMLASAETILVVAETLKKHKIPNLIVDPVMVSTSGAQLLPGDAVRNLREKLLPMTTVLTPNIPEATLLLRDADVQFKSPSNLDDLKTLAQLVHQLGPQAVLLKGGHMPLTTSYTKASTDAEKSLTVDILYDGKTFTTIESAYLSSKNTHGTGCSLASAIAANIASSHPTSSLPSQIRHAVHYVSAGILLSDDSLGHGSGPINHFHSLSYLPFSPGHFIDYLLSHPAVSPSWHAYTHHTFPEQMALGTLPLPAFKAYLVQDYLYLVHFARMHALAAYKSRSMAAIAASASIIMHIEREQALHVDYCAEFGLTREQMEMAPESLACTAYSRYILDVGASQDWLALQMAIAPCLIGYGQVASRLILDPRGVKTKDGNRYWKWVENYVADDYTQAVQTGRQLIEEHIVKQAPGRIEELVQIFVRATQMEAKFWDLDAHIIE